MPPGIASTALLLRALRIVALVYAIALVGLWAFGDRLMFLPHAPSYRAGDGYVRIPVGSDTIAALWLPNPSARWTVLFSHGNGEDLGDDRPYLEEMRRRGFAVLAYDYRGYGASTGRPTERNAYADEAAAYAYLTRTLGVAPQRIIVHGRSLGGGPAAELASREPVAGVVLESTFTSVGATVGWGWMFPVDHFRTARRLKTVRCPVLVIHGTDDGVVPFSVGRRVYELAPRPKRSLWVTGAGHDDLVDVAGERYWAALHAFGNSLR